MCIRKFMNEKKHSYETDKAVQLFDYLLQLASLRTKIVRNIEDYQKVLWLSDIPHEHGCFTRAWGPEEEYKESEWLELQNQSEPELPSVPPQCKDWIDPSALRDKNNLPELLPETQQEVPSPERNEEYTHSDTITRTTTLDEHPEVQKAWNYYLEDKWLPWTEQHTSWEHIHRVYAKLFSIRQEQIRLGEEYELVLGLGLLTWQTPNGQRVRRHLVVADAILDFDAHLGKFTVRPNTDGPNIRTELDMLDIEEQPIRAEETAKQSLKEAGDDPWERECVGVVLQSLAHSISPNAEYQDTLSAEVSPISEKPVVEYAPALILRKLSSKGLTDILKKIQERIKDGGELTEGLLDLIESGSENDSQLSDSTEESQKEFSGEIFFPKTSNEEQRRIVDNIRTGEGVLVQGPPGTGKSHTIANLICHLLATGNRILVTAKTPRALQVLVGQLDNDVGDKSRNNSKEKGENGLLPEEIKPLCISLLGRGQEERKSLEASVGGILRKNDEWDLFRGLQDKKRTELTQKLRNLREEQAKVKRRLVAIRESETHSHSIADGAYRGTAARIAKAVNENRKICGWFVDKISPDQSPRISLNDLTHDLSSVLENLRRFSPEKRNELNLTWPAPLPKPQEFSEFIQNEENAGKQEKRSKSGADEQVAGQLFSKSDSPDIECAHEVILEFHNTHKRLRASPYTWMQDALRDILGGNSSLWHELFRVTEHAINIEKSQIGVADETVLEYPDSINNRNLREDAVKLMEHLSNGKTLGWGPFRSKIVKERLYVIKDIFINGHCCSTIEDFSDLIKTLDVRIACEKTWRLWKGRVEKTQGPYSLQLTALQSLCEALNEVLSLEKHIEECRDALRACKLPAEPVWADNSQVERLISSCRLALARHQKHTAKEKFQKIEATVASVANTENAHPVSNHLLQSVRSRDIDGFEKAFNTIQELDRDRRRMQKMDKQIEELREMLPKLMEDLAQTCKEPHWDQRLQNIEEAWRWAQARYWVEEYIQKGDVSALDGRLTQVEAEINNTMSEFASIQAWSFCFSRLKETHRRHMEAWQLSMRRLSKGTGKHAPRYRREAQKHLNECREAVPAWIMPLHRIWDTVDPEPGMFDVIIVDEASQCGFEALPLFHLGKKILIVGDDKQISPEAVGLRREAVHQLMEKHLKNFRFKDSFDVESSIFDHGRLRYGRRRITLREHFRCMPEIIRFSNDLCYSDTPLIPLRQYGPNRLPPLEHVFVNGGYREGTNNRAINRPEAEAVVERIVSICNDGRYDGKSLGVVVLQGEAQAGLIEKELLERLDAEEMEKRRLVCGNPYSFQGDERDIMLLSMVAAPNARIGPLARASDERRFNVAASRARDQMILFHSVTVEDLSNTCLRRQLLEFFENSKLPPRQKTQIEPNCMILSIEHYVTTEAS